MTQYATGTPMGDAVYAVNQSGAGEWQISGGLVDDASPYPNAHGYITQQWGTSEFRVDVDDSGAESVVTGELGDAVRAFAHATRVVEATVSGRAIARQYMSSGTVGSVLAQFATTGRARLDLLTDDAERTKSVEGEASWADMENLTTEGYGYREPVTARSIAEATVKRMRNAASRNMATIIGDVFAEIGRTHPAMVAGEDAARSVLADVLSAIENTDDSDL